MHPTPWTFRRPSNLSNICEAILRADEYERERADQAGRVHWEVVDAQGDVVRHVFMTEAEVVDLVEEASTLDHLSRLPFGCMTAQAIPVRRGTRLPGLPTVPAPSDIGVRSYHAHMLHGRREWFRDDLPCSTCRDLRVELEIRGRLARIAATSG